MGAEAILSQGFDPFPGSSQSPLGYTAVSTSSSSESWRSPGTQEKGSPSERTKFLNGYAGNESEEVGPSNYFKNPTKCVAKTLKRYIPFDPAIPLLGFYPKEIIRNN